MSSRDSAHLVGIALAALLLAACGLEERQVYDASGVVVAIPGAGTQVKIAHEDIPGLMPAMTMDFDVPPSLLEGVGPGSLVRFQLERRGTALRILSLEVTGHGDVGAAGPARAGLPVDERAPDFTLTDQAGQPLSLSDLREQALLVDFVFTRCQGPCPLITAAHVDLQRRLPESVGTRTRFLSITVDPGHDTPERLRAYAEERGADLASWSFLTGHPDVVAAVLRDYYVATVALPGALPEHVAVTYLIAPGGRIAQRYLGLDTPPAQIIADLEEILG